MSKNNHSMNILLVELIHLAIGTGFGFIPYGYLAGIAFVLWKELYRDPRANFGEHGVTWLWDVPETILGDDGIRRPTVYRWGLGPLCSIEFARKAWIDMVCYFTGMALGIGLQPW